MMCLLLLHYSKKIHNTAHYKLKAAKPTMRRYIVCLVQTSVKPNTLIYSGSEKNCIRIYYGCDIMRRKFCTAQRIFTLHTTVYGSHQHINCVFITDVALFYLPNRIFNANAQSWARNANLVFVMLAKTMRKNMVNVFQIIFEIVQIF